VASSRFVDSVAQSVHTKLFFKCRENLVEELEQGLGIRDQNGMPSLLFDDPHSNMITFQQLTDVMNSCRRMQSARDVASI
jgi:hypothetical protein